MESRAAALHKWKQLKLFVTAAGNKTGQPKGFTTCSIREHRQLAAEKSVEMSRLPTFIPQCVIANNNATVYLEFHFKNLKDIE